MPSDVGRRRSRYGGDAVEMEFALVLFEDSGQLAGEFEVDPGFRAP